MENNELYNILDSFKTKIAKDIYRDIFPLDNIGNDLFTITYLESKLPGFEDFLRKELNFKSKGYYGEDIWGIAHNEVKDFLQKGMTFYYEIVGFLPNGGMIQKDYDYGCEPGKHAIYIYRITSTNVDGKVIEFSAKQVQDFCKKNGLNAVPELYYGYAGKLFNSNQDGSFRNYDDDLEFGNNFLNLIKEKYNEKDCYICSNKVPEEGCVIRIEGNDLEVYKAKSERFYLRETAQLDKGESNIEDEN
jgi:hypothetical protein